MTTPTENVIESLKNGLISFKDGLIGFINEIINNIAPNYHIEFVFVISLIIAIIITRWQEPKRKYIYCGIVTLLVYFSLRFLGVGG